MSTTPDAAAAATADAPPSTSPESLTPLEQEVLDEYARLLGNLNSLSTQLSTLSTTPSAEILDALRGLERKTSLVFTLLKASVYSIVLQQQIFGEGEEGQAQAQASASASAQGGFTGFGGAGTRAGSDRGGYGSERE